MMQMCVCIIKRYKLLDVYFAILCVWRRQNWAIWKQ